jgi:hypothetical protein
VFFTNRSIPPNVHETFDEVLHIFRYGHICGGSEHVAVTTFMQFRSDTSTSASDRVVTATFEFESTGLAALLHPYLLLTQSR